MADSPDIPRQLLEKARGDEVAVRALAKHPDVSDSGVGFHAQQAVEKSLKAVLELRGVDYPYSHDIDGLIELSRNTGIDIPDRLSGADYLSPFSVGALYGGPTPTHVDRDQALEWSASAVAWAGALIDDD
jgi:hypothetical protein